MIVIFRLLQHLLELPSVDVEFTAVFEIELLAERGGQAADHVAARGGVHVLLETCVDGLVVDPGGVRAGRVVECDVGEIVDEGCV